MTDDAAALTYYAILALLPALLVAVMAFGVISPATAEDFISHVSAYAPAGSGAQVHESLARMLHTDSVTWSLLGAGTVSALWSASSYLAVFRRTLHALHGPGPGRAAAAAWPQRRPDHDPRLEQGASPRHVITRQARRTDLPPAGADTGMARTPDGRQ